MKLVRLIILIAMLGAACLGAPRANAQTLTIQASSASPTTAPVLTTQPATAPTFGPGVPWIPLIQTHADQLASSALMGAWISDPKSGSMELVLSSDGRFRLDSTRGTYVVRSNILVLTANSGRTAYTFSFDGPTLILQGGDLRQDCSFYRQTNLADAVTRLLELSPESIQRKFLRIAIALSIMLLARLFILLLEGINYLLLYSTKGPLTFLWRTNRARAKTVHSLILNFITYTVYLTALGFILGELGINYTAYIASLSVVGLAIGFGSQGLVQDMVTGFFLVIESQFDVGDMIEISGQTGVVVEFGLRTTTIRNYVGQIVIIPNRNILQVGRYKLNSQLAQVDVQIPADTAPEPVIEAMKRVGQEISSQYAGVIEGEPTVASPAKMASGQMYVRMNLLFWPGQNWVVDTQLVPRLRAALKSINIDLPPEKIGLYYHVHESEVIVDWRKTLGWKKEVTKA